MGTKNKTPSKDFAKLAKKEFNQMYRAGYTTSYIARFSGVKPDFVKALLTEKSIRIHNTKTPIR